jgi:hypothetical protein
MRNPLQCDSDLPTVFGFRDVAVKVEKLLELQGLTLKDEGNALR